jgi:hypothetical protein
MVMMVAVSDMHRNSPALQAVCDDISKNIIHRHKLRRLHISRRNPTGSDQAKIGGSCKIKFFQLARTIQPGGVEMVFSLITHHKSIQEAADGSRVRNWPFEPAGFRE